MQQQNWDATLALTWRLVAAAGLIGLLRQPLALLDMPDTGRSLGVPVAAVRLLAIAVAVGLSASVTAHLGVIGFIGLGAPALARLAGARAPGQQLVWSPVYGAVLLWLTDQAVQAVAGQGAESIPTGAATALLGAPLIILLLRQVGSRGLSATLPGPKAGSGSRRRDLWVGLALMLLATVVSLVIGVDGDGLRAASDAEALAGVLPWRWPRVVAAAGAGALFGIAGTAIQRLTGNPMASPEVTGISAGAALGLVAAIWLMPGGGDLLRLIAGSIGAATVLGGLLVLGWSRAFDPARVLIAGIALATFSRRR